MKKKRILLLIIILISVLIVSGCEGRGNLEVIVRDQQQNLINDVYIGIYTPGFEKRVRFAYTKAGVAQFNGLVSGGYSIKIIGKINGREVEKESKVQINNQQTTYLKINL